MIEVHVDRVFKRSAILLRAAPLLVGMFHVEHNCGLAQRCGAESSAGLPVRIKRR
jgi:hypothetical protein